MMENQSKQVTSLTTTRLSPLAKPFTLNRSSSLFAAYPFLESSKEGDFEVAHSTMFHEGKHAVDGLNPCLTVSDGVFKKNVGTIVAEAEGILLNSNGAIHATGESSSCPPFDCKISPLKLSTTDVSSAKNTPQNQSSKNLGESDSDVDSPCWKGTVAFRRTPIENLVSIQISNVEKTTEKHNSLNPLAPQFFPGIGYVNDDFGSSNSCVPVTTNLLTGEDMVMKTVMAESAVEFNKGIELQPSSKTRGREKAFNIMDNDPKNSSLVDPVLNLHCMVTQSSSKEDCLVSKGKLETAVDVDNFVKGQTGDPRVSRSMIDVFPAKSHSPIPAMSTSSSRVGVVTDLLKTFEGVSKSLIKSPKPDVGTMVNAMHVLSELLVQTSMDGVDANNEHGRHVVMVQQIINNLNEFSTRRCGQRIPTLDSTLADSSFCIDRSLELPKRLEMTSIETLSDPHQLYPQNDYMGKNKVFKMFGHSEQRAFASSSEDQYKGNEIAQLQVIRRSLGKTLDFDKHLHPEALLFLNLWLDSEAERCYRKYKTYHCLMEAGVDVNCTTVAELLS